MSDEKMIESWKARPNCSQQAPAEHPAGAISLTAPEDQQVQSVTGSVFVICITLGSTC